MQSQFGGALAVSFATEVRTYSILAILLHSSFNSGDILHDFQEHRVVLRPFGARPPNGEAILGRIMRLVLTRTALTLRIHDVGIMSERSNLNGSHWVEGWIQVSILCTCCVSVGVSGDLGAGSEILRPSYHYGVIHRSSIRVSVRI